MQVVGIRDAREMKRKRDGQPMNAWMVFYVAPGRDVIGQEAQMQFVDAVMFGSALQTAGLTGPDQVVGRECNMVWDNRGFLQQFSVHPKK